MTRYFLATLILLIVTSGCEKSSDYSLNNPQGSKLEVTSAYKKSSFTLPLNGNSSEIVIDKIKMELVSLSNDKVITLEASVQFKIGALLCSLYLHPDSTIPDSDYRLRLIHEYPEIPQYHFVVAFRNEMMCGLLSEPTQNFYSGLSGKGTIEEPYIISNSNDFSKFMYGLNKDQINHGRGLYFTQTADIVAPETSSLDGTGYTGETFAGNYNGNGFSFSFKYTGNNTNNKYINSGMFTILNSGANISNLKITYDINGVYSYAGALAGRSVGSIEVNNLQIEGTIIDANSHAGGLIGAATGSDGDVIRIVNVEFGGAISGKTYLGGLIGATDVVSVDIKNVNSQPYQPVKGTSNVGGLIGSFTGKTITISQCTLKHSVSQEDAGIVCLNASGNNGGGIIGYANITQSFNLESVFVDMSVGNSYSPSGNGTGGLVGNMELYGCKYVNFKNCEVQGVVCGGKYVGGFVGLMKSAGTNINFIGRTNYMFSNVTGSGEFVGGMFGSASHIIVEPVSHIKILSEVKGYSKCGGFSGYLENSGIIVNDKFEIDPLTNIVGSEDVGGFVGYSSVSSFTGKAVVTFNTQSIPDISSFPRAIFMGKVNSSKNAIVSSKYAGGFIGRGSEVEITGIVVSGSVYGDSYIGGIAGRLDNPKKFRNCVSSGEQVKTTGSYSGGVVGYINSSGKEIQMFNIINYTKVSSSGGSVGGVIGRMSDGWNLDQLVNMASVEGGGSVGGVVGSKQSEKSTNNSHIITSSANYGEIKGNNMESGSMGIGGIIGWLHDKIIIKGCANHGAVSSSGQHYKGIGGIAGVLGVDFDPFHTSDFNNDATVSECINTGKLTGITDASECIGGIIGYMEEGASATDISVRVDNCLNTGNVENNSKADNGGIVGCTSDCNHVYRCLNIGIVRYGNGAIGTHNSGAFDNHGYLYSIKGSNSSENKDFRLTAYITDSNKSNQSSYKEFDFNKIWDISSLNNGYPYLRNCYFQFVKGVK